MPTNIVVRVSVDTAALLRRVQNADRRLVYTIIESLNDAAKLIQEDERANVVREFRPRTGRTRTFLEREAAYISKKDFANVRTGRPYVEVSVGQKPRLLLSGFERGEPRPPFVGKHAAIPVKGGARPTERAPVPSKFWFTSLRFTQTAESVSRASGKAKQRKHLAFAAHITSTGKVQWKGEQRTFILEQTKKLPHGGVFQRRGRGIRLLYFFGDWKDLRRRLRFVQIAQRSAQRYFDRTFKRNVASVLARYE